MKYMGIDLHKQYFVATVVDKEGSVLSTDRVSTDRASIREYFQHVNGGGELKAVMEAGYGWSYFLDEIEGLVDEVKLAHPLKTKAIAEARIKTDKLDSKVLADLLRADFVAEAYAPSYETRNKKQLLRHRAALIRMRSMLKNMAHAVLNRNHIEDPGFRELTDKFGKKGVAYMKGFRLKGNDTRTLRNYLYLIEKMDEKIKSTDKRIKKAFKEDDICKLLKTLPGIGELSAVLIRYEIDDIERFDTAGKLCSYAGLVPSTYSSGGRTYHGRITKQGNKALRWILTEAVNAAIGKDMELRKHYQKIKARGGAKKARVAVARKLLKRAYIVWKEMRPYNARPVAVAL